MIINLQEIPDAGMTYTCNQHTGELNEVLKDLFGEDVKAKDKVPHLAEFTIHPLQAGTYELSGFVRTELPEDCSRCGLDFKLKVDESFKELLLPAQPLPRNGKYGRTNHFSELTAEGPTVVEYQGHHFNAGEYLHEVIALTEPLNPVPPCDSKRNCQVCQKPVPEGQFKYEDEGFEKPKSPFANLKSIKLN
ncbi:MAG: hypothetical protein COT73_00620 [Bdellovibrio sp. CG10_big_fil_rev_8_21_14_0_10_47_8]|nr:MAG: hypothetical protein COT73_00620 [Bdellovibrio sp. CG10_big_fil_rev_8_21_14_0_10_47_8]